jgi:transcriptional regulator with XRE-family HTH domain
MAAKEFQHLGAHVQAARSSAGLTQRELAARCGIDPATIVRIEHGQRLPTVTQLFQLAHVLGVSLQWFIGGSNWPGLELPGLALELQSLGIFDLLVSGAIVPGAFRPPEQVVAVAVAGNEPEPRIVEAIPAVLAWNRWNVRLLYAYSLEDKRVLYRIGWLADIALTIDKHYRFPGGCPARRELERFLRKVRQRKRDGITVSDDLGHPSSTGPLHPLWKRWRINYDANLETFRRRAAHLTSLHARGNPVANHD